MPGTKLIIAALFPLLAPPISGIGNDRMRKNGWHFAISIQRSANNSTIQQFNTSPPLRGL